MRVARMVHKIYADCLAWTHARRFRAVVAAVGALIRSGRLSITSLGRHLGGSTAVKHAIKRIDRLVGNGHLQAELPAWYAQLAQQVIGSTRRVVVAVDWTDLGGQLCALSAAVACRGRALVVYQEAHPKAKLGNRRVHRRFLAALMRVLPRGCAPIIVADGGFRSPFFWACRASRVDFVIRLRGRGVADLGPQARRVAYAQLFRRATPVAQCLGLAQPHATVAAPLVRLVLGPKPARPTCRADGDYRRRALEPWLLATTLHNHPAHEVVRLYTARMQIEETFRDLKDRRFGWALQFARATLPRRMNTLLLLAALAHFVVVLAGLFAEHQGTTRHYQANTRRDRRVLSLFTVGNLLCASPPRALRLPPPSYLRQRLFTLPRHHTTHHQRYGGNPPHDLYCADCGDHFHEWGWPSVK